MIGRPASFLSAFTLATLLPEAASAHLVNTRFGDFYDGMLHPLTSLEHAVPWLALGLLAGLEPKAGRWALIAFPAGLGAGIVLGVWMPGLSLLSMVNVVSIMVLGALVALAWPLPAVVIGALACAFGIGHGYANGTAMTAKTNPALFASGVLAAGYLAILLTAALAAVLSSRWHAARIGIRALGSWIFAIGVMLLGVTLAT